jgi:hypothetical protein
MSVQVVDVRDEISGDAPRCAPAGASGQTARLARSPEKSERFVVATKAVTTLERRGRTRSKGRDEIMAADLSDYFGTILLAALFSWWLAA